MQDDPYHIAVIGGDGIGPEVVQAELAVLEATGLSWDFRHYDAGDYMQEKTGQPMPAETIEGAKAARAVIFGAAGASAAQVIIRLRMELGTYVNLRPSRAYPGVPCLWPETDLYIVRENTECLYIGDEKLQTPERAIATRLITAEASRRIARWAFEYAKAGGFTKVTTAHKANVLKITDGLYLDCCRQVAADYPDIALEEALIDSLAMRLVLAPSEFGVVVTTNLFGDILSDLAAGLIGGLGLCPSANLGDEHALFEPVHGSAPDIAGQGKANPSAAILCGAMLLDYLGEREAASRVNQALERCLAEGQTTGDLGGKLSTMQMADAVIDRMG